MKGLDSEQAILATGGEWVGVGHSVRRGTSEQVGVMIQERDVLGQGQSSGGKEWADLGDM